MRRDPQPQTKEVNTSNLEAKLVELTTIVQQFVKGNSQQVLMCGVCANVGHHTDMCPTLHEDDAQVNAMMGGHQGQHQRHSNYHASYNSSWKPDPNLSYAPQQQQHYQQRPQYQQQQPQRQPSSSEMSLEDIVKSLATSTYKFQQETKNSIANLEAQIGDLTSSVSKLEARGRLPSQTEKNPRETVNAISLRNGRQVGGNEVKGTTQEEEENIGVVPSKEPIVDRKMETPKSPIPIVIPPPFPSRFATSKKKEEEKEIMNMLRKVEINIPLLDAIQQFPRYAKILKDFCTNKRKLKGNEKISMSENVSAVLQRKLPPKYKDPGMFTVPCKIGDVMISSAMLDLGASINVMPYSVYKSLNVGQLSKTGVVLEMSDKSNIFPRGVLEDVLVQVNQLVFPADFYVIDLDEKPSSKSGLILLGRPFLSTAKTIIDVHGGSFTMEFDGEKIEFNINDAMKYASDVSPLYFVDMIEPLVQHRIDLNPDKLSRMRVRKGFDKRNLKRKRNYSSLKPKNEGTTIELDERKLTKDGVAFVDPPDSDMRFLDSMGVDAPVDEA
ncbi:hypothetical protein L1887_18467 [Cichorium endivia]|nr:hypothetical protein L1887_18467 [Cichorium endivia]